MIVALSREGLLECQKLPSARDFRVLLALLGHLDRDNMLVVGQGLTRQGVWLSFQRLQAQNILQKERRGSLTLYYLNEKLGRKVAQLVEIIEEKSEEDRALDESFGLIAKLREEERRMKAACITGVISNPFPTPPEDLEGLD